MAGLADAGLPTHGVRVVHGGTTPTVTALFDPSGDLGCCVADVRLLTAGLDAAWIRHFTPQLRTASVVLVDGACATLDAHDGLCNLSLSAETSGLPSLADVAYDLSSPLPSDVSAPNTKRR